MIHLYDEPVCFGSCTVQDFGLSVNDFVDHPWIWSLSLDLVVRPICLKVFFAWRIMRPSHLPCGGCWWCHCLSFWGFSYTYFLHAVFVITCSCCRFFGRPVRVSGHSILLFCLCKNCRLWELLNIFLHKMQKGLESSKEENDQGVSWNHHDRRINVENEFDSSVKWFKY